MKIEISREWSLSGSPILGDEEQVIWLDIETKKVPAPEGWPQKRRWQTFLVAVAGACDPGIFFADVVSGTEREICEFVRSFEEYEIRYAATREFDEMVLRGRFTNARRAHESKPGPWPNLNREKFQWRNVRKTLTERSWDRAADVPSREVPDAWAAGRREIVIRHCLRDVLETVLRDPDVKVSSVLRRRMLREIV